ncbi:hypothetical protein C1646_776996 [Rhizophagus diaphanus]|nr:hypothetical protein C1646_776996 [Rhizophagus diaphanus] [Rhizophagus sp. MUCL 43196]
MEDIIIEAVEDENENLNEIEPRYNLRSRIQDIKVEKMEENLQGASLDDALDTTEGKNRPERIAQWPNDTYCKFMEGEPNFSHGNRSERSFREPYECNWWLKMEKTLTSLNNLLSIILYSDVTTLDGLEKSSEHLVFLTLVKPDSLHFGIKERVKIFATRISFFLVDMLKADEITATFKLVNCKMLCHTCIVLRENFNEMDFESAPPRIHENMQQVIRNEQKKDHLVHSTCNAF